MERLQYTCALVSALVASFTRLLDAHPTRQLIHLPAQGQSLTVEDIWRARSEQLDALRACGLQAGQLLLVAVGNRPSAVSLFLAARALDLAVVAVDAGATATEVAELCERYGVAAVAAAVEHAAELGTLRATLGDQCALLTRDGERATYTGVALLKLTSGSTGLPKAARISDAQLIADSRQIAAGMQIGPDDTQIAVIPLSHAYGLSVILVPLIVQGTAMVLRESFVPHQLPADARTYRATTFPGVPFMFDYFLGNPPPDGWPDTLRTLISAGARLPGETVRDFHQRYGVKIHSFYGASEAGGISYDRSDDVTVLDTVGWPLPDVTITLRDDPEAPAGCGRVHVQALGVAGGYVGGGDGDEFTADGFLTGDFGRFDDAGRLVLTGRASSFINVAGKKVQPADVEETLRQMPGVLDVRVLGAADPQRGEQVAACIVAERGERRPTTLAVRRFCSARLAPFKIPRVVVFLDAMPLTARGKVDRRALDDAVRATIAGFPEQLC